MSGNRVPKKSPETWPEKRPETRPEEQPGAQSLVPPIETALGVAVYFFCSRFVAARALQRKLELHKTICHVQEPDDLGNVVEATKKKGGIILFHISQMGDVKKLKNFVVELKDQLQDGRLAILAISRIQALQIKSYLNGYPSVFVYPAVTALAELEKKVFELLKKQGGEVIDLAGVLDNSQTDKGQRVLRYTAGTDGGTFVLKGNAAKKNVTIQEGNGPGEMMSATQAAVNLRWDKEGVPPTPAQADEDPANPIIQSQAKVPTNHLKSASLETEKKSGKKFEGKSETKPEKKPHEQNSLDAAADKAKKLPPAAGKSQLGEIFQTVTSAEQRQKFLRDSIESRALVTMTSPRSKNEKGISGQFFKLDPESSTMRCLVKGSEKEQQAFRSQLVAGQPLIFSAALRQSRLFMATPEVSWLEMDPRVIELKIPDKMYFVQRRRAFRLVFFPGISDIATFSLLKTRNGDISLPIYDVSEGGFALLATAQEATRLKDKEKLFNLKFQIEDLLIHCPVISKRHITLLPLGNAPALYRIGYQFSDLKAEIRTKIGQYIQNACQDYFSSYLAADKLKPS